MKKNLALLMVLLLILGSLGFSFAANENANENANKKDDKETVTELVYGSIEWDQIKGIDSQDCGKAGEGERPDDGSGWIHWVANTKGNSTEAELTLSGSGSGTYEPGMPLNANVWHFYTPYFELDELEATMFFEGEMGQGVGLVISDFCIGDDEVVDDDDDEVVDDDDDEVVDDDDDEVVDDDDDEVVDDDDEIIDDDDEIIDDDEKESVKDDKDKDDDGDSGIPVVTVEKEEEEPTEEEEIIIPVTPVEPIELDEEPELTAVALPQTGDPTPLVTLTGLFLTFLGIMIRKP